MFPTAVPHSPGTNRLLAVLPAADRERLAPALERVSMALGDVVYESGSRQEYVYFPTTAIVSLLYVMADGASAEIAVVGNDGMVGIALFMGGETTPSRAIVQSAGSAFRLSGQLLKREFARAGPMQQLLLRYTQALLTQMAQTAVCNRHHSVDQQLCRWLLLSLDRLPSNELAMTQEQQLRDLQSDVTGADRSRSIVGATPSSPRAHQNQSGGLGPSERGDHQLDARRRARLSRASYPRSMSTRYVERFFAPESVVVVGASERPDSFGGYVLRNLRAAGYAGETLAVHPEGEETVYGVPRFSSIRALPGPPDLAVLCNAPEAIPGDIRALGKAGVKAALVLFGGLPKHAGGGFFQWTRELLGRPLETLREATLKAAAPYDLRIMGPNCMGIISPHCRLNASFSTLNPAPGETAFVGQCGMLGLAFADWAARRRVGFSHLLTLGDSLDVDMSEVIEYLGEDPATRVILLHIERFPAGARFLSALRAVTRSKVVIALKSGHAPELEGLDSRAPPGLRDVDAVHDAVLRRAGVLRIESTDELGDAMASLAHFRGLAGERLAILANGAGPGMIAVDALHRGGGSLARFGADTTRRLREFLPSAWTGRNPVDLQPDATPGRYRRAIAALGQDAAVDAILVVLVPTAFAPPDKVARALIAARSQASQPVCASWMGESTVLEARDLLHAAGVPSFNTPEQAVASLMLVVRYQRAQMALQQTPRFLHEPDRADLGAASALLARTPTAPGPLSEPEVLRLLSAYGIVDGRAPASNAQDDVPILSFGITRDATFGPLILFGEAASAWRTSSERAVGLPPLNDTLANLVVASTPIGRDLQTRPGAEATLGVACRTLIRLSRLVVDVPVIRRLELEAAIMSGAEVHMLRASLELGEAAACAIAPYPEALRETVLLPGWDRELEIRPIRGEDEPKHLEFLGRLSAATVRNRVFSTRSSISHRDLARLTQIDYGREMAFVAETRTASGDTEILGVVRSSTDPDNASAEFAIVVRDDVSGAGLGRLLLEKLIRYTRDRSTPQLRGITLPDNTRMLHLAEQLGFSTRFDPDEEVTVLEMTLNAATGGERRN